MILRFGWIIKRFQQRKDAKVKGHSPLKFFEDIFSGRRKEGVSFHDQALLILKI
jgi:flagellar biogenesis protein FliO